MIPIEIARYFQSALIIIILLMSLVSARKWQSENGVEMLDDNRSNLPELVFGCLIIVVLLGLRPITSFFGDTGYYAVSYNLAKNTASKQEFLTEGGWGFDLLQHFCIDSGFDVSIFFTIVAFGYIFFALWGIRKLFKNNVTGAMLFFLGAFSFFSYGTNGIRNGLACSIIIAAISYVISEHNNFKNLARTAAMLCGHFDT